LEEIATGGAEGTVALQVIKKLDEKIGDLKRGLKNPAKYPGKIAQLTGRVKSLHQELARARREVDEVEHHKVKLVETSSELDQVELKLGWVEALLEKNKCRKEIEENIAQMKEEYDKMAQLVDDVELLQRQVYGAELELRAREGFGNTESKTRLQELELEHKNLSSDLAKRRSELEAAREHLKRNRLVKTLASSKSLILGVVVSAAGFLLSLALNTAFLIAGIIGLVFLVGALWARNSVTQEKTQISSLQSRIGQMEEALKKVEHEEHEILSQVKCGSFEEFRQKQESYNEWMDKKKAYQNQLKGKLGSKTLEQVKQQRQDIARMLAVEEQKLTDDLKNTRLSPEEYMRQEKKRESLEQEKKQLEHEKMEHEANIKGARLDVEDQTRREEELEFLKSDLNREQKRVKVYELARDKISDARKETLESATDLLQAEIQEKFKIFTNGKYGRVKADKGSMDFNIYSEEKGDWVRPDELSGGVIDEFYLACRVALVRLIYGEIQPPLILDDPFTNFDEPRLAGTLEFLSKLSKEHQIIIFTLGRAYDSVADRVIELA
jgi:uncharacterized protein YhaN